MKQNVHIAIIWQRFLSYHIARIKKLQCRCDDKGYKLTAIEVAAKDDTYGFPSTDSAAFNHVCCFPKTSYHELKAKEIHQQVMLTLEEKKPDIVFAPATPFPEGMGACLYRLKSGKRVVMMDDAWEHTDKRGGLTNFIKRQIHQNMDVAFVPALSHASYYERLGFSRERMVFGVDVVDNDFFSSNAEVACVNSTAVRQRLNLPDRYFLFVGRFLPRKGLECLVQAYRSYRKKASNNAYSLVLVGAGDHLAFIRQYCEDTAGIVFVGPKYGEDLALIYGLASALVVPSEIDPWALVVNEGMAAGLPVMVSRGCGAAHTLVREGKNGWTFEPDAVDLLSGLMSEISGMSDVALARMGATSREIIAAWSLDHFADSVLNAIEIPRRPPAGLLSNLATTLWKGRVSVN